MHQSISHRCDRWHIVSNDALRKLMHCHNLLLLPINKVAAIKLQIFVDAVAAVLDGAGRSISAALMLVGDARPSVRREHAPAKAAAPEELVGQAAARRRDHGQRELRLRGRQLRQAPQFVQPSEWRLCRPDNDRACNTANSRQAFCTLPLTCTTLEYPSLPMVQSTASTC